jgi:hypothetical protein
MQLNFRKDYSPPLVCHLDPSVVQLDPQESLAQRDEGSDVLNPVRVQVLQLDAIVVQ